MVRRTQEEKATALLQIQQLQSTDGWHVYEREVRRMRDAISAGAYRETGEQIAKTVGIIHGIDITLEIGNYLAVKKTNGE